MPDTGHIFNGRRKSIVVTENTSLSDLSRNVNKEPMELFQGVFILVPTTANVPVVLVPDIQVGFVPRALYLTSVALFVNGATAWTDATATKITIQDSAGVPFLAIAKASLTANAVLGTGSGGVTLSPAMAVGGTPGKGLVAVADNTFAAGSPISVQVTGYVM